MAPPAPWTIVRKGFQLDRLVREDRAVSPVIGMILILAISITGIAAIMYWGMPAIDEMKAEVEAKAVEQQFHDLDGTIQELIAGTTEKTAKRWQPALNRGQVSVHSATEPWVFATEMYNITADHDFQYGSFADANNLIRIKNAGVPALLVTIEAYVVTGTSTLTQLNVSMPSLVPTGRQMTPADLAAWPTTNPDHTKEFLLYLKDIGPATPYNLGKDTVKFRIFTGTSLVAEAWYTQMGRIDYTLHSAVGERHVLKSNGALITGDSNGHALINAPPIPPLATSGGIDRFFSRAIVFKGDAGFAGQDQFDLLVSLYATAQLAGYDCAKTDRSDCVETAKLFILGSYRDVWHQYMDAGRGYTFTEVPVTISGESIEYLSVRKPYMGYTLIASTIQLGR